MLCQPTQLGDAVVKISTAMSALDDGGGATAAAAAGCAAEAVHESSWPLIVAPAQTTTGIPLISSV